MACASFVVYDAAAKPAGHRRAVLVGVNDYTASGLSARPRGAPPLSRDWPNLSGAVNDVEAMKEMLVRLYDFEERDIVTLTDQSATRSEILEAVGQHLAKPAARGDVLLFYFAGHGSQVQNSLSDEADKLDESLVPADSRLGVLDIRDKELRPLFNRILDRGARLSVILDNCHSGSGARGRTTGRHPRGVRPDLRDIADRTNYGPRPEDRGALVLSATQDTDAAWETRDDDKKMHGAFSWAWIRAMRDSSAGESAAETFARATARLRAERAYQEPVIAGTADMMRSPFLGKRVDRHGDRTVIAVERVRSDGTVFLQGGWANGLEVGCELRVIDHSTSVRVTITAMRGLGRSEGRIPDGSPMPQAIRSGALLEVVRWVAPGGRPLRVWMPRISESIEAIASLARKLAVEASRRGVRWIKDPLSITPSHLIRRGNREWELLDRDGEVQYLGTESTDAIAAVARIPAASSLFVQFPAPAALIDGIDVGPDANCDDREGIDLADRPEDADYILVGRYLNRRLAYAWVRPWTKASDERKIGMPLHSEWIVDDRRDAKHRDIAPMLREAVMRLRKIHSWQRLESPPEGRFAYQLDVRRERDGQWAKDGAVIGDEKYALFLRAANPVAPVPPRFIYVFTIDSHGRSFLLFGTSSVENRFPRPPLPGEAEPPSEISLGPTATFHVASPYGVDTFFLLTTDEPLPNPRILEWEGVRKGAPKPDTALEELLIETATGSRIGRRVTPSTWSIERVFYEAVPPRESKTSR
ncbi:MAG: caspase family protein [Acidobacteriota bacterium]|nr:caspase family protein [Acidobacteriota bacterium]